MKIGLVVHFGRHEALHVASTASRLLRELGADVIVADQGEDPESIDVPVVDPESFADGLDLAISFGGDGTFLQAAHLCRDAGVPVLGVNLGRLGFLAEVEQDELHSAMQAVVEGAYEVVPRSTLEMTAVGPDGDELRRGWALNEVSVEKTARQRLLLMDVHVGERLYTKVPADALVIATSTGSTGYALSAGGPILSPMVDATLVVPVAPHTLFDRTLVCASDETVRVDLPEEQPPAVVSCDGREPVTVQAGGHVTVVGGGRQVMLARVGDMDFYTLVRRKFGLR